jgi:probable F420-dependent oxidoreductase
MKVDAKFDGHGSIDVAARAIELEAAGFDAAWTSESAHDPFLPLMVAAANTDRLRIGTAVAVAFARSPMNVAHLANDLQLYSGGRFVLGLGSQVKPHIERRFSMPWSRPAARMREYILALRAIWRSWETGERLAFSGEFYTHTLMAPFFSPGPNPHRAPPVHLAAVGEAMTEVAGEVADGIMLHPFTTRRYLVERTLPALERGARGARREVSVSCLVATGTTDAEMADAVRKTREQIAFYGSTPAYRGVLDLHGWGELGVELTALSVAQRWAEMGRLVDDDVLNEFAVVAAPQAVGAAIEQRFGGLADRVNFYAPYDHDARLWLTPLADLHEGSRHA